MLKAGGGWDSTGVERLLNAEHPSRAYSTDGCADVRFELYTPPPEILRIARSPHAPPGAARDLFHFLPVALGLALYPDWPDKFGPDEQLAVPEDVLDVLNVDPTHGHS